MSKSKIEWTDATWNPTTGCSKVSQGCKNCYAEREWPRMTRLVPAYAGRDFSDVRTHADRLDQPIRWKRPRRIFVNSMSDLFHESVPDEFIDRVFAIMALAKQHVFQVLTKRPDRMRRYMARLGKSAKLLDTAARTLGHTFEFQGQYFVSWPIPNVWIGVSVEDQAAADERIPLLLDTPAAVRWISAEPLLGLVNVGMYLSRTNMPGLSMMPGFVDPLPGIDWVVVGGESGPKARPMHPDWARDLRDQCVAAGVPFLFKQWGEWAPYDRSMTHGASLHSHNSLDDPMQKFGKKAAGRLLDGAQHDGYPEIVR